MHPMEFWLKRRKAVTVRAIALGITAWIALVVAAPAQLRAAGPVPSQGHYRLPFADGTDVEVFDDFLTHRPPGRNDLFAVGGYPP